MKSVIIAAAIAHFNLFTLSMRVGMPVQDAKKTSLSAAERSIIAGRLKKMSAFPLLPPEPWILVTEMKEENCLLVTRKF